MLRRAVPPGKWPPPVSDIAGGSGGGQLRLPATVDALPLRARRPPCPGSPRR